MYRKTVLVITGSLFVFLGVVGIFLPLLPTTPFLLLAAACYAKGSKKLHFRLLNNRFFGEYIRNYYDGKGIPLRTKILAISMLWLSIGGSILFVVPNLIMKGILILIAAAVTVHIVQIKTPGS